MATADFLTPSTAELRFRLNGTLHEPGEPEYEDACAPDDGTITARPRHVVRCLGVDCVGAALFFAAEQGLDVAVRSGRSAVTGASPCEDGVLLDLRALDAIRIDPERRVARAGAGCTRADLDRAAGAHGLTTGGGVATPGDDLLAVELVTPTGELLRASADEHPELLRALRGSGGSLGVVCTVELALHPVTAAP